MLNSPSRLLSHDRPTSLGRSSWSDTVADNSTEPVSLNTSPDTGEIIVSSGGTPTVYSTSATQVAPNSSVTVSVTTWVATLRALYGSVTSPLEVGVLALLPTDSEPAPVLAAVLAFRALYYLLPFLLAVIAYAVLEWRAHRRASGRSRTYA